MPRASIVILGSAHFGAPSTSGARAIAFQGVLHASRCFASCMRSGWASYTLLSSRAECDTCRPVDSGGACWPGSEPAASGFWTQGATIVHSPCTQTPPCAAGPREIAPCPLPKNERLNAASELPGASAAAAIPASGRPHASFVMAWMGRCCWREGMGHSCSAADPLPWQPIKQPEKPACF